MNVLQKVLDWLTELLKAVILLLPDSPFVFLESDVIPQEVQNILPYVNWFIPVASIVEIIEIWLL